jgi:hypothetical protein
VTNEIEEHKFRSTELDEFKQKNTHLERYHSIEDFPGFGDSMRMNTPGIGKADSAFEKGVIQRMIEKVPRNNLRRTHKTKLPREW